MNKLCVGMNEFNEPNLLTTNSS